MLTTSETSKVGWEKQEMCPHTLQKKQTKNTYLKWSQTTSSFKQSSLKDKTFEQKQSAWLLHQDD